MRLALLITAGLSACGPATAEQAATAPLPATVEVPEAPGTRVEAAAISPSVAALRLRLPGEVSGARDALLGAANGGYVEAVNVSRGQVVRRGQVIARIDTAIHSAQRDQAQAQFDLAESEVGRLESVENLASEAQLEAARTNVAVTRAALALAEARLARARVTAPFSGVIGQTAIEAGEVVAPGSPVVRLLQLDPVRVTVSVSDRDIGAIKLGHETVVTTDAVAQAFSGTVVAVDPAADLSTRTFIVEVSVDNPDGRLLPGMIATVEISSELEGDATVIPQDWLVTSLDGNGVFVVEDSVARWRPVTTGRVLHDQVAVTGGISDGDVVVTTGHRSLADGDPLLVSRTGTCCTNGRVTY